MRVTCSDMIDMIQYVLSCFVLMNLECSRPYCPYYLAWEKDNAYSFVNLFIQTSLLCTSYNVKIVPMGFILFFTNYPSTGTCLVAFRLFQAYFCSFTLVIDMLALSILNHLEATQEQYNNNNTKKWSINRKHRVDCFIAFEFLYCFIWFIFLLVAPLYFLEFWKDNIVLEVTHQKLP